MGDLSYSLPRFKDWEVTADTWKRQMEAGKALADPDAIGAEFGRDARLMFNTLFPTVPSDISQKLLKKYPKAMVQAQDKALFLKRLILFLHYAGVKVAYQNNDIRNQCAWDLPLAALFGHGQRFLIELNDGLNAKSVVKYLAHPKKGKKKIYKKRMMASHATRLIKRHMFELKYGKKLTKDGRLKSSFFAKVGGVFGALRDGILGRHHGFDLAYGGLGNPSLPVMRKKKMVKTIIGPSGHILYADTLKRVPKMQHGHLYMHVQQHGKQTGALLVGLESSAPGKKSIYNNKHSFASGIKDSTKEASVSGGHKWQRIALRDAAGKMVKIGQYGGVRATVSQQQFKGIQKKIEDFLSAPQEVQEEKMRAILLNPPAVRDGHPRVKSMEGEAHGAPQKEGVRDQGHVSVSPVVDPIVTKPGYVWVEAPASDKAGVLVREGEKMPAVRDPVTRVFVA